jgi:mannitol-1-/sugar-/sorbitol-6-/2-deoxyglucose-6-phosphatase
MIKAVIFDMDGLLVDSEPLWHRVNDKVYETLGITLTDDHHRMMVGQRIKENVADMYRQHPWEGPSVQEVDRTIIQEVVALIKKEVVMMPGVHHALGVCKKAGLPVAIASASDLAVIDAVVDTLEIRDHFDHIYSAQFEEYGKPHPGVFLKVAKHFGVAPAECLVLEDSPNGVLAAKSARMVCVAVPNEEPAEHPRLQIADEIIGSLEEFDETLIRRLGQAL